MQQFELAEPFHITKYEHAAAFQLIIHPDLVRLLGGLHRAALDLTGTAVGQQYSPAVRLPARLDLVGEVGIGKFQQLKIIRFILILRGGGIAVAAAPEIAEEFRFPGNIAKIFVDLFLFLAGQVARLVEFLIKLFLAELGVISRHQAGGHGTDLVHIFLGGLVKGKPLALFQGLAGLVIGKAQVQKVHIGIQRHHITAPDQHSAGARLGIGLVREAFDHRAILVGNVGFQGIIARRFRRVGQIMHLGIIVEHRHRNMIHAGRIGHHLQAVLVEFALPCGPADVGGKLDIAHHRLAVAEFPHIHGQEKFPLPRRIGIPQGNLGFVISRGQLQRKDVAEFIADIHRFQAIDMADERLLPAQQGGFILRNLQQGGEIGHIAAVFQHITEGVLAEGNVHFHIFLPVAAVENRVVGVDRDKVSLGIHELPRAKQHRGKDVEKFHR